TGKALNPRMITLQKLASSLDISVNDFFEERKIDIIDENLIKNIDIIDENLIKNVDIEKQKQIDTVAAHLEDKHLTPKKVKLLKD
ncbi:hypothetical protein FDF11_17705, partial [Clostridium botulinum]|nr:hypothetical protein [Clostridium botulinum]